MLNLAYIIHENLLQTAESFQSQSLGEFCPEHVVVSCHSFKSGFLTPHTLDENWDVIV